MEPTFTKKELIRSLADAHDVTITVAQTAVDFVLDSIHSALVAGRRVEFRKFGVLKIITRRARTGRNPRNPAAGSFTIPAKRVVKFCAASKLQEALNSAPTKSA